MKAIWNGIVIAESNNTQVVEGNQYFPPNSINREFFIKSETTTVCPWKGTASYYTIKVDDKQNPDAAWYYPDPKNAAMQIKNHIAFWRCIEVRE